MPLGQQMGGVIGVTKAWKDRRYGRSAANYKKLCAMFQQMLFLVLGHPVSDSAIN